jgi:hypothetical protein
MQWGRTIANFSTISGNFLKSFTAESWGQSFSSKLWLLF